MATYSKNDLLPALGTVILYFLSVRLNLMLIPSGNSVALFWPASGIALAALLVYGIRLWPAVVLGSLLGNLSDGFLSSLEISAGATLEAVVGAWYLHRFPAFNLSLTSIMDVFGLLLVATGSALFSALNGPFWLDFNAITPLDVYPDAMLYWWMRDVLGIVLFTPLVLSWLRHKSSYAFADLREEGAYFVLLLLVCMLVFGNFGSLVLKNSVGLFLLLTIVVWAAMRFNMRITILGAVIVFCFSIISVLHKTGPFSPVTAESIREAWFFNLVMGLTGLVVAISNYQRKQINKSLQASEADLKRAQAIAKIGSWQLDVAGSELRWSDETCRIFGLQAGVPRVWEAFYDCVHPDDRALVEAAWEAALRNGSGEIEHRILVDGKLKWVQERAEIDFDSNGHAVSAIGTVRDVTAMREIEARLHLSAKVFASSGEAIMITDEEARIVAVNSAFTSMTGYTEQELLGKNPRVMASGLHDQAFFREMWKAINDTGHWQGEIWDRGKNGRIYPKWTTINLIRNEQGRPVNYIAVANDITERKIAEKNIEFLAYYDVLTGLANRTLLHDRLTQVMAAAHRDRQKFSLLFLDIDRFKYVNDSMGHAIGDKLLQLVARRMLDCVREGDTVSRIGGDEFVVLLRETDESGAAHVAEKILKSLAVAYDIEGTRISTYASIGISVYPDHAGDIDTLIRNADMAMYHAKSEGRNNFQFYTPDMNLRTTHMFAMEKDISLALERQEFSMCYQPQVGLRSGRICGVEVLLRWQHPERGNIPPTEFIPVAEETGQIMLIGEWVLHNACAQMAAWRKQGMTRFPIAVNVSIRQLRQPNLAGRIASMLEEFQLLPGDLELELTEGIMMENSETAMTFLTKMHELGVLLSIDDFGTGFSSLGYLKKLPIDKLKIDQTFVRDIETDDSDAAIVRSIISLGHRLGLSVIAEGVETVEQLDFLRICGCDEIQGYYFGHPLVADEFFQFAMRDPKLNTGVV